MTSCENVPDTYFSITSHHYIYFPITIPIFPLLPHSPSRPSAHVWSRLLVHCLTAQRGTYTSSEHLTVLLLSLLMYVSRTAPFTSSPYLPSNSSSYPSPNISPYPLPCPFFATSSPINVHYPNTKRTPSPTGLALRSCAARTAWASTVGGI